MNVAGGLLLLSSQCSLAAFGAAGEVGHSGVPVSGMCHLVGAQPGGTAKASMGILFLCVPAPCCLLCNSNLIRKVHISVGLPGQYSPISSCVVQILLVGSGK